MNSLQKQPADSPAMVTPNWYLKNYKFGMFVGGDATAVFRANNGTTAEVDLVFTPITYRF